MYKRILTTDFRYQFIHWGRTNNSYTMFSITKIGIFFTVLGLSQAHSLVSSHQTSLNVHGPHQVVPIVHVLGHGIHGDIGAGIHHGVGLHHAPLAHAGYASSYPAYKFAYSVNDPHTGDIKSQEEIRHGDVVKGGYSLVEPDGNLRSVRYGANDHTGFNAIVHHSSPHHHVNVHHGIHGLHGLHGLHSLHGLQGVHGLHGLHGLQGLHGVHGLQGLHGLHGIHGGHGIHGIPLIRHGVYGLHHGGIH